MVDEHIIREVLGELFDEFFGEMGL